MMKPLYLGTHDTANLIVRLLNACYGREVAHLVSDSQRYSLCEIVITDDTNNVIRLQISQPAPNTAERLKIGMRSVPLINQY